MYPRFTTALLALLGGATCVSPPLPVPDPADRWPPSGLQQHCQRVDLRDPARVSWLTTAWQRVVLVSATCLCVGECASEAVLELELDDGPPGSITSVACLPADAVPSSSGIALDSKQAVRFEIVDAPEPRTDGYVVCFDYRLEREPFS